MPDCIFTVELVTWIRRPFVIFLVLLSAGTSDASESLTLDQLRQNLKKGWQYLRDLDRGVRTYDVTIDRKDSKGERSITSRHVKIDGPSGLWSIVGREPEGDFVKARSPVYAFVVGKPRAKDWLVQSISIGQTEIDSFEQNHLHDGHPNLLLLYPLSSTCFATPLPDPAKQEGFEVTGFKTLADGKLSVHFTWNINLSEFKKNMACEGQMQVNPKLSFAVEEWDVTAKGLGPAPARIKRSWSYSTNPDEPKSIFCVSIKEDYPGVRYLYFLFENHSTKRFPADSFRLTHYGLTEPKGVAWPSPTPWWLWITLASVGSVALAICYFKLMKRNQNSGPAKA